MQPTDFYNPGSPLADYLLNDEFESVEGKRLKTALWDSAFPTEPDSKYDQSLWSQWDLWGTKEHRFIDAFDFENLPTELQVQILKMLDVPTIKALRLVDRRTNDLINTQLPYLVNTLNLPFHQISGLPFVDPIKYVDLSHYKFSLNTLFMRALLKKAETVLLGEKDMDILTLNNLNPAISQLQFSTNWYSRPKLGPQSLAIFRDLSSLEIFEKSFRCLNMIQKVDDRKLHHFKYTLAVDPDSESKTISDSNNEYMMFDEKPDGKHLYLKSMVGIDYADLLKCERLREINFLTIEDPMTDFTSSPPLQFLDENDNAIGDPFDLFSVFPDLHTVCLANLQIDKIDDFYELLKALTHAPALKNLILDFPADANDSLAFMNKFNEFLSEYKWDVNVVINN